MSVFLLLSLMLMLLFRQHQSLIWCSLWWKLSLGGGGVVVGGVQSNFHVKPNSVELSWGCVEVELGLWQKSKNIIERLTENFCQKYAWYMEEKWKGGWSNATLWLHLVSWSLAKKHWRNAGVCVCVFIPSPVRVGTLLLEVPGTPIGASFFRIWTETYWEG